WRAVSFLPGAAQYLEPGAARQAEVEEHRGVAAVCERVLREHAVADPIDGKTMLGQSLSQALTDHVVVFHEQDAHRASRSWRMARLARGPPAAPHRRRA